MNKIPFKLIGVTIAVVLVSTALYYALDTQKQKFVGSTTYLEYKVQNFGSYEEFNSFLTERPTSSSNSILLDNSGDSLMPRSDNMNGIAVEEKATDIGMDVDYSDTNIQELGVDEPDIVKTDGEYLYVIANAKLYLIEAYPPENARIVSMITFNESYSPQNLFINGDRLAVIAQSYIFRDYPLKIEDGNFSGSSSATYTDVWMDTTSVNIVVYDISDRSNPRHIHEIQIEGYYSNARMISEYVYVITTQYEYEPVLYTDEESGFIPKVSVDGAVETIGLSDIYYMDSPTTSKTLTHIVALNILDETEEVNAKVFLLGDPSLVYVSTHNIYIASILYTYDYYLMSDLIRDYILPILPSEAIQEIEMLDTLSLDEYQKMTVSEWIIQHYADDLSKEETQAVAKQIITQYEKTTIHSIGIDQGNITYQSQGTIPGSINNQFSMSEYEGYLRIASTVHGWMMKSYLSSVESYNNVYVLDDALNIVGQLEDIAVGEQIYSARFLDTICYLVTYEQIDPFFVIDLQDPEYPTILGELKIPGFSTYLHPYDETHVIGIGQEENLVKVSLFNVEDVFNPQELSTYQIQRKTEDYYWSYSTALYEHKAFLFDREKQLLIIPVSVDYKESAYVFDISQEDIILKGIIAHDPDSNDTTYQESGKELLWVGDYRYSIKRSLYIEDVLYTISDAMVKINDLNSLAEIASIDLY
jgi:uncharacterized secreted protein with C-terminal beta-propeller domain